MANDIVEITDAEFDDLLEDQTPQIKKWSDLENKKNIFSNKHNCGGYSNG